MAILADITTGAQAVTAAGAVTGSLDTSGLTGDYTIKLRISALAAGKRAVVAVQDTANATAFSEAITVAVKQAVGSITADNELNFSWRSYELPLARYGAANTKLRINVLAVDGSPGLTLHAWLER